MDGCLIDTEEAYAKIWNRVFKEYNVDIDMEEIESWRGVGWEKIRNIIHEETGDFDFTMELRRIREVYFHEDLYAGKVSLKPYALDILNHLKGKKRMALGTSTYRKKAGTILEHFNLFQYFNTTVFGDDVQFTKPDPAIYLEILKIENTNHTDAIIFEDSKSGIKAANGAKIDVVYVPDRIVLDTSDVDVKATIHSFKEVLV